MRGRWFCESETKVSTAKTSITTKGVPGAPPWTSGRAGGRRGGPTEVSSGGASRSAKQAGSGSGRRAAPDQGGAGGRF
jgi:hypothetical protein